MATLGHLQYTLNNEERVAWTENQLQNSLSLEYPFDPEGESAEEYAYRTYLQFLWLPEVPIPSIRIPCAHL